MFLHFLFSAQFLRVNFIILLRIILYTMCKGTVRIWVFTLCQQTRAPEIVCCSIVEFRLRNNANHAWIVFNIRVGVGMLPSRPSICALTCATPKPQSPVSCISLRSVQNNFISVPGIPLNCIYMLELYFIQN